MTAVIVVESRVSNAPSTLWSKQKLDLLARLCRKSRKLACQLLEKHPQAFAQKLPQMCQSLPLSHSAKALGINPKLRWSRFRHVGLSRRVESHRQSTCENPRAQTNSAHVPPLCFTRLLQDGHGSIACNVAIDSWHHLGDGRAE